MRRFALVIIVLVAAGLLGWGLLDSQHGSEVSASAVIYPVIETDLSGFARALAPREWHFPADYGPHMEFQTEWWYYTGNLATESGRRFGYQFTVFRRAITPEAIPSASEWRTNQLYLGHFTVTDVQAGTFHQSQRLSRASVDLAGAVSAPRYDIWVENWQVVALDDQATQVHLTAGMDGAGIDFILEQARLPALQGDHGLSVKGDAPGNASYYYSLPRSLTSGTLTLDGTAYQVSGTTWMDHEFSTGAMPDDSQGWDWFGLHLDDGRDLMVGRMRLQDGGEGPIYGGLVVLSDGSMRTLTGEDFDIEATASWTSPHTGAIYPAGWQITVRDEAGDAFTLILSPLVADQELAEGIPYWEGAVRITGDATGYGYAELTGYATPMRDRF